MTKWLIATLGLLGVLIILFSRSKDSEYLDVWEHPMGV